MPPEQLQNVRSSGTAKTNRDSRYSNFSDEEQEKINKMKSFIKHFALDERKRAKQLAAENLQQSRRPPVVVSPTRLTKDKSPKKTSQPMSASLDLPSKLKRPNTIGSEIKTSKTKAENKSALGVNLTSSISVKPINGKILN